jgi:hypothetical protein
MRKLLIIALLFASCTKQHKTCYRCQCTSASVLHTEDVCTDGSPNDKLPSQDANGAMHWQCREK